MTKKAKAKKTAKSKRSEMLDILIEGAMAQIEEVASEVVSDPDEMLSAPKHQPSYGLRGRYTESVQSILAGGIDAQEARRLLASDLAPFVDGPSLAMVLRYLAVQKTKPDDLSPEIADAFAVRAVDDLARALVALALDRRGDVPATCEALVPVLEEHVPSVEGLLEGA